MHPLGLSINGLILNEMMGINIVISRHSILLQNKIDFNVSIFDLSDMQTQDMLLLMTNVGVPPKNSWYPYTRAVHFEENTGLAVMSVSTSDKEFNLPPLESAAGMLRYVAKN